MNRINIQNISILTDASVEFEEIPYHEYGPRKYLLFGKRDIIRTTYMTGAMIISDMLVDFKDAEIILGEKYLLESAEKEYVVMPCKLENSVHTCAVDYFFIR